MTSTPRHSDEAVSHWNRVVIPKRVMDRAYARTKRDANDCWISTYSVASHGYAQIGWNDGPSDRHVVLAHRAVWERFNGRVPVGMTLDHTCKTKRCVNPAHLRLMDNFENGRRTHGMDWELGECANGHPNSMLGSTFRVDKQGNRRDGLRCSECRKFYQLRYAWKQEHPGDIMPDHLLLASERSSLGEAA